MRLPEGSRYLGGGVRSRSPEERREDMEAAAKLLELADGFDELAGFDVVGRRDRLLEMAAELRAMASQIEDVDEVRC